MLAAPRLVSTETTSGPGGDEIAAVSRARPPCCRRIEVVACTYSSQEETVAVPRGVHSVDRAARSPGRQTGGRAPAPSRGSRSRCRPQTYDARPIRLFERIHEGRGRIVRSRRLTPGRRPARRPIEAHVAPRRPRRRTETQTSPRRGPPTRGRHRGARYRPALLAALRWFGIRCLAKCARVGEWRAQPRVVPSQMGQQPFPI